MQVDKKDLIVTVHRAYKSWPLEGPQVLNAYLDHTTCHNSLQESETPPPSPRLSNELSLSKHFLYLLSSETIFPTWFSIKMRPRIEFTYPAHRALAVVVLVIRVVLAVAEVTRAWFSQNHTRGIAPCIAARAMPHMRLLNSRLASL